MSKFVEVWFGGKYPSHDIALFYQDFIVKEMQSNAKLKQIGCTLDSGDSIGDNGAFKAEKEGVGGGLNQGVAVVARIIHGVFRVYGQRRERTTHKRTIRAN